MVCILVLVVSSYKSPQVNVPKIQEAGNADELEIRTRAHVPYELKWMQVCLSSV